MRHRFFSILMIALGVAVPAMAQNYTNPERTRQPSVIINLDALRNFGDRAPAEQPAPKLTPPKPTADRDKVAPHPQAMDEKPPAPMKITEPAEKPSPPPAKTPSKDRPSTVPDVDVTTEQEAEANLVKPTPPVDSPPMDTVETVSPTPAEDPSMQTEPVEEKKTSDDMISDNTKDPDVMQDGERLSLQPERKQVEDKIDMEPGDGVVDRADDDITPPAEEIQEPPPTTTEMAPQKDDQAETKSTRVITPGKIMHLFYQGSATDLSQAAKSKLGPIVDYLTTNDAARLQIRAFASQRGGQSASDARRLSLSRALALRSHLMENGISSLRLDVRALGSGDALSDDVPSDLPKDRIDLRIID